jgi:hypothetical protein
VVRFDRERLQDLIQQVAMLRRDHDAGVEFLGMLQKLPDDGCQFDRFGPRAEDEQGLYQGSLFVPVGDAPFGEIVRRHLQGDAIAC